MITSSELYKILKSSVIISKEVIDIFLELDTTSSTTTQASLNEMLITVRNRLEAGDKIIVQSVSDCNTTIEQFDNWLKDKLTDYSYKMYKNSIKGE